MMQGYAGGVGGGYAGGGVSIPVLEGQLRAFVDVADVAAALSCFDRLLRRRRTPHQTVCTSLLTLCVTNAPRSAMHVLEGISEGRGLDVDDFCRIIRMYIRHRPSREDLERFQEIALDILTFSDDSMHNYFAHVATLLNLELHEQLLYGNDPRTEEIGLVTHKRQLDAAALLCKKGSMLTPIFHLLMAGMGGREGAQDAAEMRSLSAAPVGIAEAEAIAAAEGHVATLGLNASQSTAVKACIDRRLTLIQGPPGTGKTTVAVHIITMWVRVLGVSPVLCCADSNVAVDNIAASLVAGGVSIVRLGRAEAVRADVQPFMAENLGGAAAVAAAQVVLATCVGSGADSLSKAVFEYVLIDETAQSTEPSCLVPLTRNCRSLVLVGDHRQLRPTVVCEDAAQRGLKISMFERFLQHGVEPFLLDTQYRMHRSLAEFPSKRFYGGRLQSGTADGARPQPRGVPWPSSFVNVALVPSSAPEEGSGLSKRNAGEAHTLIEILRSVLMAGDLRPNDVGIVAPYTAQVALLRQMIANFPGGRAVEIMSVDGFQGREKELILFSAVRSGRSGSLGFVSDERRLNVMLTRAKRGLVVVGDPRTLVYSRHWADWLQWVQQAGAVVGHRNWVMPPRPARSRARSPSFDEVDALGRLKRASADEGSGSDSDGKIKVTFQSRAERRRRERKAKRAASRQPDGADAPVQADSGEEEQWRAMVMQAKEAADRDERLLAQMGEVGFALTKVADGIDASFVPPPADKNGAAFETNETLHGQCQPPRPAAADSLSFGLKPTAGASKRKQLQSTPGTGSSTAGIFDTELATPSHLAASAATQVQAPASTSRTSLDDADTDVIEYRRAEGAQKRAAFAKMRFPIIEVADFALTSSDPIEISGDEAELAMKPPVREGLNSELLPNWCEAKDEGGKLYYYCEATMEVTWEKPCRRASF